MASAHNATGGAGQERNQLRKQERGQSHRAPGAMARRSAQPLRMGRASEQAFHSTRNKARSVALNSEQHRGGASQAGEADIRKVQAALNQQGFNVGDPDGKLGQRTKAALIAFQKQRGFQATGKVDRATLHALIAGGAAPGGSPDNNQPGSQLEKSAAPSQPALQGVEPSTTGQGGAAPQPATAAPEPIDRETPPAPLQMPDSGASGRVPAGSPQEEYTDDVVPSGDDQR